MHPHIQVDLLIVSGSFTGNTKPSCTLRTRLLHASYTPLLVSGSLTGITPLTSPLTRLVHASYTPRARLFLASYWLLIVLGCYTQRACRALF
jgi:hypothetical protein